MLKLKGVCSVAKVKCKWNGNMKGGSKKWLVTEEMSGLVPSYVKTEAAKKDFELLFHHK